MRRPKSGKTPTVIIRKIREAILDEVFTPGDWLPELDLAAKFQVSRSPIREALLALEKEGTVVTEPRNRVEVTVPGSAQVQHRGNVGMTQARRRAGFAQKTKPRQFITEILFAEMKARVSRFEEIP
jgi:DNA-binding GntR family transcriptional regulator